MDIFGWGNHSEILKQNWIQNVKNQDIVIIPGDFSWAMNFEEAYQDFAFINHLPGKKILSKGNHDYWWNTVAKVDVDSSQGTAAKYGIRNIPTILF